MGVLPNLPNLANLKLSDPTGVLADRTRSGRPRVLKVKGGSNWSISQAKSAFLKGAVFACKNGEIELFNPAATSADVKMMGVVGDISVADMRLQASKLGNSSKGASNNTFRISRFTSWMNGTKTLLRGSALLNAFGVDSAILRVNNDDETIRQYVSLTDDEKDVFKDMLFQEAYLTLMAAKLGVGVKIYGIRFQTLFVQIKRGGLFFNELIPRVVYLMEAGSGSLASLCGNVRLSSTEADMLFELVKTASTKGFLLTDLKPGNVVYFTNATNSCANFKLIDFGSDHSAFFDDPASFDADCLLTCNALLFSTVALTSTPETRACLHAAASRFVQFLKNETGATRATRAMITPLCDMLETSTSSGSFKMKSMFDDEFSPQNVTPYAVDHLLYMIRFYATAAADPLFVSLRDLDQTAPFIPQVVAKLVERYEQDETTFDDSRCTADENKDSAEQTTKRGREE